MRYLFVIGLVLYGISSSAFAKDRFTQTFGKDAVNTRILKYIGPAKSNVITETGQGLLIRLPAEQQQAGLATRFMIEGDFEITMRYEFVDVPQPEKGYGAGVVMRMSRPDQSLTQVGIGRRKRQDGSDKFNAIVAVNVDGKPKTNQAFLDAKSKRGGLRFVRKGTSLVCMVVDGDGEAFQELRRVEFDAEPIKSISVLGDTGALGGRAAVRITSLTVESETLPFGSSKNQSSDFNWIPYVIGTFGVLVLVSAGYWYWRR